MSKFLKAQKICYHRFGLKKTMLGFNYDLTIVKMNVEIPEHAVFYEE